jgi:hypothetical protein
MSIPIVRSHPALGLSVLLPAALLLSSCGGGRKADEPPAAAVTSARQLSQAGARSALGSALAFILPAGSPLPTGSALTLGKSGWRSEGRFANATGTLRAPGDASQAVSVGFVRIGRDWKITYLEPSR